MGDEELSDAAHHMLLYDIVSPGRYRYNATVAQDATDHPVDLGPGAVDRIKSKIEGLVQGPTGLSRRDLRDFVTRRDLRDFVSPCARALAAHLLQAACMALRPGSAPARL